MKEKMRKRDREREIRKERQYKRNARANNSAPGCTRCISTRRLPEDAKIHFSRVRREKEENIPPLAVTCLQYPFAKSYESFDRKLHISPVALSLTHSFTLFLLYSLPLSLASSPYFAFNRPAYRTRSRSLRV